ncbi:MAG TPA: DUF2207 domain-containing protein [Chloroflexi bacterium]|nr:DUF2207 domain-containing protein [Chloroflexota bacterium]
MRHGRRSRGWLLGFFLALALLLAGCGGKSVEVLRRQGEFFIRPDGRVEVTETWEVRFRGGPFRKAFRSIPYYRLEGVSDWQIAEDGQTYREVEGAAEAAPYTFWVEDDGTESRVVWRFPETHSATRTFTLRYTLHGVLWVAEEGDRFFYAFIEADRGYSIRDARATVHLPAAFPPGRLETATFRGEEPSDDEVTFPDQRTVVFHARKLAPGERWEIGVSWPHGAVQAASPAWQREAMRWVRPEVYQAFLRLEPDGRVRVTETWRLHFVSGPFTEFTRTLPQTRLDRITDWGLSMDGQPCPWVDDPFGEDCALTMSDDSGLLGGKRRYEAVWHFPETNDATHTFTFTYTVWGAVAQGERDQLHLTLVDSLFPPWPSQKVEVGLALPSEALQTTAQPTLWAGKAPWDVPSWKQDGTWWFRWAGGATPGGTSLAIEASWPGALLALPVPAWQQRQQARIAAYHQRLFKIGLLTAPFVLLVVVLLVLLFLLEPPLWPWPWPKSAPPEALPPALVGVLLDRQVLQRHVLATLWDLARKGYLRLEHRGGTYRWRRLRDADVHLLPYEQAVLESLFPGDEKRSCSLATAQRRLEVGWDEVVRLLEIEALGNRHWFRWPWHIRAKVRRVLNLAVGVWGFVFVGGCLLVDAPAEEQKIYLLWPVLLGGMLVVQWWLPRRLPPRTWGGWRAAARWRAYRLGLWLRWLRPSALSQDTLDETLAYATAFGLGPRLWRRLQARPPAAASASFAWVHLPAAASAAGRSSSPSEGGVTVSATDALNAAAGAVFAALEAAANGVFSALNAATAPSTPSSGSSGYNSSGSSSSSGFGGSSSWGGSTFSGGGGSGGGSSGFGE